MFETGSDFFADFLCDLWTRLRNFLKRKAAERNKIGRSI